MSVGTEKVKMHFNSLDFIKICATFAIIFHHYQEFFKIKFDCMNFYYGMFPYHSMVYLFFIISGFVISRYKDECLKKRCFKSFIKKRAKRLLPMTALTAFMYEIALIIFAFLTKSTFNNYTTEIGIKGMGILNGFGMIVTMTGTGAGWFWKGSMANEVTWYICVLLLCYVVFYFCCRITNHLHINVNYAFAGVIMVGVACGSYGAQLPFLNAYSLQGYIPFFIGVMLGEFMKKRSYSSCGIVFVLGTTGLILSVIYVVGMVFYTKAAFADDYWLMFVAFPSLIIVFFSEQVKNIFKHQIWRFFGGYVLMSMSGTSYA